MKYETTGKAMHLKNIVDEFSGYYYKDPYMLLVAPTCTWKCNGCKHAHLSLLETKDYPDDIILKRFNTNPRTKAIVIGGLEPFDSEDELHSFIFSARKFFEPGDRPVLVISTGYYLDELKKSHHWCWIESEIVQYGNAIIKCGRSELGEKPFFNPILGVYLDGINQYVYSYVGHQYL